LLETAPPRKGKPTMRELNEIFERFQQEVLQLLGEKNDTKLSDIFDRYRKEIADQLKTELRDDILRARK
jgi:hypothetical protein